MIRRMRGLPLVLVCVLAACGGSDEAGEPLLSGSVQGSFDGMTFTAVNGFATLYHDAGLIGVGDGPLHCGSEQSSSPPPGNMIGMSVPSLAAGAYSNVIVEIYKNKGGFEGVGANTGTVTLTAVTDASVAGTVSFSYTDDMGRMFTANGTFEVVHCPP